MDFDFDDTMTPRLRGYIRLVSSALGLSGDCWCMQAEHPVNVYLALDGRLPAFPDRDVALLWDEKRGWSVAVETHSGGDLIVLEHLDGPAQPAPGAVAQWVRGLFHPSVPEDVRTPRPRVPHRDDVSRRSTTRTRVDLVPTLGVL